MISKTFATYGCFDPCLDCKGISAFFQENSINYTVQRPHGIVNLN